MVPDPDSDRPPESIPAPIEETLREPLEVAAGRGPVEEVASEIEAMRAAEQGNVVGVGDVEKGGPAQGGSRRGSVGGDSVEKKGSSEEEKAPAVSTHHANGLVDQTAYMPVRRVITVFLAMQLAVLLSFLDQTIVSTSLPNISAAFDAGRSSSFVAAAYLLTSTAFQPIWGRLSDVFGRKVTLIACVVFFTIGSLACAVAQSMLQLIIFRGLQGVGGGGLLTLVLIIVSDVVTLKERGKYQGITESTIMIGNGIGPIIGGVFAQKVSWRWMSLSIVVIAIFLPLKQVKGSMKKKLKQIDYGGSFLTMSASVLLILPLNWGGTSFPWVSGPVLGCLIAGVLTFAIFFVWEGKIAKIPVVPPAIFKQRTVATIFFNTFCSGATILVQLYYIPQYLQVARGYSAIRSGVLILPQLVLTTFWVFVTGQLIARTGQYKPSICVGYAIWTVGLGLLSTLDQNTSDARLIGFLIINATGQGQTLQSSMVAAQAAVARSEMSVVTSTRNFCRSLGGTIFLVIASAILNNTLRSNLNPLGFTSGIIDSLIDDPTGIWRVTADNGSTLFDLSATQKSQIIEAYVKGFHTLFRVFVGMIGGNCITATLLIERHSLKRKDEDALKQRGREWVEKQKEKKKGVKGGDVERGEAVGAQSQDTVVELQVKADAVAIQHTYPPFSTPKYSLLPPSPTPTPTPDRVDALPSSASRSARDRRTSRRRHFLDALVLLSFILLLVSIYAWATSVETVAIMLEMTLSCATCTAMLAPMQALARLGDGPMIDLIVGICQGYEIEAQDVCLGAVQAQVPILAHDLRSLSLESRGAQMLCSALVDLCPINETTPYTVALSAAPQGKVAERRSTSEDRQGDIPVEEADGKSSGRAAFQVLHLSDVHIDREYVEGSEADCGKPICCRDYGPGSLGPNYGARTCDSPPALVNSMLAAVERFAGNRSFTIFTGDVIDDAVWAETDELVTAGLELWNENLLSLNATNTSTDAASLTVPPVYGAFGNHDTNPVNAYPLSSSPDSIAHSLDWVFDATASNWQRWIGEEGANSVRQHSGCYSVVHPGTSLRVVSVNTNTWYNQNFYLYDKDELEWDPNGILTWLIGELEDAEQKGQRVWILGHVSPGRYEVLRDPSNYLSQILDRYSSTIAAHFYGHIHADEFQIGYSNYADRSMETANGIAYVHGSLTPRSTSPGFRIYDIDPDTYEVMNFRIIYADMNAPNYQVEPNWTEYYSARDSYNIFLDPAWPAEAPLNASFWHLVTEAFLVNDTAYEFFNTRSNRGGWPWCTDEACKQWRVCGLRALRVEDDCGEQNSGPLSFDVGKRSFESPEHAQVHSCEGVGLGSMFKKLIADPDLTALRALHDEAHLMVRRHKRRKRWWKWEK
ncbi:hypothetical protein JCM5296_006039 [Sporobolomyces johnsonii]